jgi:DeoR/GlpR family transcriptional regulator of sugar metabolism
MLTAEREQRIIELLRKTAVLSVADLSRELDVSPATIRRDLQSMHERKLLRRVRGGATLRSLMHAEPLFQDKESRHREAKEAIAAAALELIEDHDRIYLDGGSTVMMLARQLDARRGLTIVTNSLMAAEPLMNSSHRLILVGGEFRPLSRTVVGPLSASVIHSIHVNKAFMGTIGFTVEDGMTTTDPQEAFTKDCIMQRADQVILLADSSKLGAPSFAKSGRPEDIDVLVTESIDPQFRSDVEALGIEVVLAT